MEGVELVMRLDTDSKFTGQWVDAFDLVERAGADYMFNKLVEEWTKFTKGMPELAKDFIASKGLTLDTIANPQLWKEIFSLNSEKDILQYFNNFQITRRSFWLREDVREWVEVVDNNHGIFLGRWGDAPLTTFTLAIFCPSDKIVGRNKTLMPYDHNGHTKRSL